MALTVENLYAESVVVGQFEVGFQSLVPRKHQRSLHRRMRQTERVPEFVRGHRKQTGSCGAKKKQQILHFYHSSESSHCSDYTIFELQTKLNNSQHSSIIFELGC